MKQRGFTPVIVLVSVIALAIIGYLVYQNTQLKNSITTPLASPEASSDPIANWKTVIGNNGRFSYKCPPEWMTGDNLNYGGKVKTSECTIVYAGRFSFDDGGMVTLGFIPNSIPREELVYADSQIDTLKTFENTTTYSKNGFEGFISGENDSHTLQIIARKSVGDGYYEVTALAMGNTNTEKYYTEIFDLIISSFKVAD